MTEITTGKAIALVAAVLLFYLGVMLILNAEKLRQVALRGYDEHRALYTALFFGDWIVKRAGLHLWLIRSGGLFAILMAAVLFFAGMFGT